MRALGRRVSQRGFGSWNQWHPFFLRNGARRRASGGPRGSLVLPHRRIPLSFLFPSLCLSFCERCARRRSPEVCFCRLPRALSQRLLGEWLRAEELLRGVKSSVAPAAVSAYRAVSAGSAEERRLHEAAATARLEASSLLAARQRVAA